MSEVATADSIHAELKFARDAFMRAIEWERDCATNKPRAEIAFDNAYAQAFIRYREAGDNDALAKQRALFETAVVRQKFIEYKEGLMAAKSEVHAWGSLFEAYRSLTYLTKQEMKFTDGYGS